MNDHIETVFIEFSDMNNTKCILGTIYRPPNTNIDEFLNGMNKILQAVQNENKKCYIMGDYNVDLLKTQSHGQSAAFVDLMFTHSFLPMINRPTRVTAQTATCIDNIYTNNFGKDIPINGVLLTDISDHFPIFHFSLDSSVLNTYKRVKKRHITRENLLALEEKLSGNNWEQILECDNPQSAYDTFSSYLITSLNDVLPLVPVKVTRQEINKPWLTKGLLTSIRHKNKLLVHELKFLWAIFLELAAPL